MYVWDVHTLVFSCDQTRGENYGQDLGVGPESKKMGLIAWLFTCQGPESGRVGPSGPSLFQSSLGADSLCLRQYGKGSGDTVYGTSPVRLKAQHQRPGKNI